MDHHLSACRAMRADDFLKSAENGQIVINCHQLLLRIAYIYVYDGSSNAGVFSSIDDLHKHGWSFGGGDLRFNRYEPLVKRKPDTIL